MAHDRQRGTNEINNNNAERNREALREDFARRQVIEEVSRELARIGDSFQAMYTPSWLLELRETDRQDRGN